MKAKFDSFDRFETPLFTLCYPNAVYENGTITRAIGALSFTSDEEIVANFNEVSELNLVIHKVSTEDDPLNLYSIISNAHTIYAEDIGFFCIDSINEHITEEDAYKEIKARSCEAEIENRTIPAAFYQQPSNLDYAYNTTWKFDDLIDTLVSALPLWTLAYTDTTLVDKFRTFEDISEETNILSFMLKEIQEAYECLFIFDIIKREIYIYDQANYLKETSIHLSNRDLVQVTQIAQSAENVFSAITVSGEEGLTISGINPLGTNTIYKYDYFFDSMSPALAAKVADWESAIESAEEDYYQLSQNYNVKLADRSDCQSEISALTTQIEVYRKCRDNVVAESGLNDKDLICYVVSGDDATQIANTIASSGIPITVVKTFVEELTISNNNTVTLTYEPSTSAGEEITALYIKDDDGIYIKALTQSDTVSDDTFTYNNGVITFQSGQFSAGTKCAVFYPTDNEAAPEDVVPIIALLAKIDDEIGNRVGSQTIALNRLDALTAEITTIQAQMDAIRQPLDMATYFTEEEFSELTLYTFEGAFSDEYVIITDSMTYPQRLAQSKILYDHAKIQLAKVSEPTEQFNLDVENFVFQSKFEDWASQLETGCLINVELRDNYVIQLFLSKFDINYEDEKLSMTFGNKYTRLDTKSLFENALGNVRRTANTLNFIKETLTPITSGEFNAVKRTLANVRKLSAGQALASDSQAFTIDDGGITGKQTLDSGEYSNEQLKIINNMIALTDDAWQSCKVAIGKIILANGETAYGVNAEVLMGDMILGNELHILADNGNGEYGDILSVVQNRIEAHVPEIHAVTTNTGYTFNDNGLMIERSDSEMVNILNNEGMEVALVNNGAPDEFSENIPTENNKITLTYNAIDLTQDQIDITLTVDDSPVTNFEYDADTHTVTILSPEYANGTMVHATYYKGSQTTILTAKNDGVATKNLTASEFLMVGAHARFENYSTATDPNRTACFYI